MAYLRKTKQDTTTPEAPQSTLLSGGGALGSAGAPQTGTAASTQNNVPAERTASTPSYVSGQQYLEGNRAGARKLAGQIVDPIKRQASDIEAAARRRGLAAVTAAGSGSTDEALMSRAATDARTLSADEQARVRQTLSGQYGGPASVDFGEEAGQVAGLGEATERLGTVAGLKEELGRMGGSGGRKYTGGMRAFDAMLMRQDPTLRTQLEAQKGLGERVAGTIEGQQTASDKAIAAGRAGAGARGVAATKRLQDVASGQEGTWTDALGNLRTVAGGVADRVAGEQTLSARQLALIGLSPEAYDEMRDAYVASSYGRSRPLTRDENYNYDLNSPTQFTAGNTYKANAWKNFQLDDYATGLNVNDIGYGNVVDAESLAKYQALNALRGGENVAWAPQTAGTGNLEENALNFNNIAAQQALANFMKSGVAAPSSNLDVMEGQFGAGGYQGIANTTPQTPGYTKTGADYQQRDPLTGKLNTAFEYTGKKSPYGGVLEAYDQSKYQYDTSIDSGMLRDRALRSGYEGVGQDVNPYVNTQYQGSNFVPANEIAAVNKRETDILAQIAAEKAAAATRTTEEQQAVNKSNLGKTVYAQQDDGQVVGQKMMTSQYSAKPKPPAAAPVPAVKSLAERKAIAVQKAIDLAPKPARGSARQLSDTALKELARKKAEEEAALAAKSLAERKAIAIRKAQELAPKPVRGGARYFDRYGD